MGAKKSRVSLSPDQIRLNDTRSLRSSKQSVGFGISTLLTNRAINEQLQSSKCTLTELQKQMLSEQPSERECQILTFCEQ